MSHFGALTSFASLNIVLDVGLDSRPPVVVRDEFLSLVTTRMSGRDAIMVQLDDLFAKSSAAWHIDTMFPGDEFAIVVPVLLFVGEGFDNCSVLCVIVFLDLREDVFVKAFNVKAVSTEVFGLSENDI